MPELTLKSLKGKKELDELFKAGVRFKVGDLFAVVEKYDTSLNNPSKNRIIFYTVSISKKFAKKAVVRNRIKRLLRESIRILLKQYPERFAVISKMVLLWHSAPTKPLQIRLKHILPVVDVLIGKVNK